MDELAVVARLLPVVAEDLGAGELGHLDLRLPRPVGAHEADVLARPQRPWTEHGLMPGRHRDEEVGRERLLAARRHLHAGAELVGGGARAALVHVPEQHAPAPRREHARHRTPVDPGADHGGGLGVRPAERLGGEHGRSSGAQRGDRGRVERRLQHAGLRVGEEHEPGDRRQPARRVAREGRHPLQERVAGAERGHRAEVARRVSGHVDLGRHRPLAARVRDKGVADDVHRTTGRDGLPDEAAVEERHRAVGGRGPAHGTSACTERSLFAASSAATLYASASVG